MIKLNGTPINVTKFPDGTSQVWKLDRKLFDFNPMKVEWYFENESEVIHLMQLRALLEVTNTNKDIQLYIDYLPYGRQDKLINNDSTFGLIPFTRMINSYRWQSVRILDPHSHIALITIENSHALYCISEVETLITELSIDLICYPDKGAVKKYTKLFDKQCVYFDKVRDQCTGNITSLNLIGDVKDCKILILDDLCDGGKTFIEASKLLHTNGAEEVNLFVTHGLFTKGLQPLFDSGIKRIYSKIGEHK